MPRPDTVPPSSGHRRADVPAIPFPPASGQARVTWWDALATVLELDLLQVRLGLRADGLTPLEVEAEMAHGYRPWILSWTGAVIDKFEAELIWLAA